MRGPPGADFRPSLTKAEAPTKVCLHKQAFGLCPTMYVLSQITRCRLLPLLTRAYLWEDCQVLHHQQHILLGSPVHGHGEPVNPRKNCTHINGYCHYGNLPDLQTMRDVILIEADNPMVAMVFFLVLEWRALTCCISSDRLGDALSAL